MVNENKTALVMYCRIKNFELLQKRRFRVVESSARQKTPKIVKKERVKRKYIDYVFQRIRLLILWQATIRLLEKTMFMLKIHFKIIKNN